MLFSPHFLAAVDNCLSAALLNVSDHWAFGRPVLLLPVLAFYIDIACAYLRWSLFATWPHYFHLSLRAVLRGPLLISAFATLCFLKEIYCTRVYTACSRTNYIIVPLGNLNKYLHYGISENEVCVYKYTCQ